MPEFILHKKDGAIVNKRATRKFFEDLPTDGKFLVKADPFKKRSNRQNSFYWAGIVPMVKEGLINMGYDEVKTNDDAHAVIKHLFLKRKMTSQVNGDEIEVEGSTAKLSTSEFNFFFEEVIRWAATYLNIQIAYPNENLKLYPDE